MPDNRNEYEIINKVVSIVNINLKKVTYYIRSEYKFV